MLILLTLGIRQELLQEQAEITLRLLHLLLATLLGTHLKQLTDLEQQTQNLHVMTKAAAQEALKALTVMNWELQDAFILTVQREQVLSL